MVGRDINTFSKSNLYAVEDNAFLDIQNSDHGDPYEEYEASDNHPTGSQLRSKNDEKEPEHGNVIQYMRDDATVMFPRIVHYCDNI